MENLKSKALPGVFGYMFLGLLITFVTAYVVSFNSNMSENIYGKYYIVLVIAELAIAIFLNMRIHKLSNTTATCLYLFYTFLTGLTLSFVFLAYEISSIVYIFLATSVIFCIFALIGKYTKLDLSKFSTYFFMIILGILVVSLINIFLANNTINLVLAILGIVVFVGFVAYDVQKIIKNDELYSENKNFAIIGAFSLYLDFINIFLDLLDLFGKSKD